MRSIKKISSGGFHFSLIRVNLFPLLAYVQRCTLLSQVPLRLRSDERFNMFRSPEESEAAAPPQHPCLNLVGKALQHIRDGLVELQEKW